MDDSDSTPGFIKRLIALLLRKPGDRAQLIRNLRKAHERRLMDADALTIIEKALSVSETRVSDAMIPRARMEVIDIGASLDDILQIVLDTGHSRFPVIDGDRDGVLGILLAKDLLRIRSEAGFSLRHWLRPAVFIPESKRLNTLLREFRVSHNHMAIVIDEFGAVTGLITIEDVLEQIVGDIEDEYDFDEAHDNIRLDSAGRYRVKAQTTIADFNAAFATRFADDEFDTIGGLLLRRLGHVPRRNESVVIDGVRLQALRADSRRLYTLLVDPPPGPESGEDQAAG